MSGIKAVLVGVGAMNKIVARLLLEKGGEIVGVTRRSADGVGADAGTVLGLGRDLGVPVTAAADVDDLLARAKPDVALISTNSFMADQFDVLASCARHGVNAITIAPELLHAWTTSPERSAELDGIAKDHGVSLFGGGVQDFFHVQQAVGMLGTLTRLDRLVGSEAYNIDDFGAEVALDQQVGKTLEEFTAWKDSGDLTPSFGLTIAAAIVAALGLTVKDITIDVQPTVADKPVECRSLGITVPPGDIIGYTNVDVITTHEGPVIEMKLEGHIYQEGEIDGFEWTAHGDTTVTVSNPGVDTPHTTAASVVNRIPDVLGARPGLLGPADLPPLGYRPLPLADYVGTTA